jgi:hypothetical protein
VSKFTYFIIYNVLVYILYIIIDKIFTSFGWFSNPNLGKDLLVMPNQTDIILIFINIFISTILAWYILFKYRD